MNIFIKQLIESIDDEDFFSDLGYDTGKEVTFLVDDNISVKNLGKNPTLQDIENIDHIGAILSKDEDTWLLWNLNNEYWEPFGKDNSVLTKDFGEIVAVCVGKGMFAKVNWTGLTKRYKWANKDNPINDLIKEPLHKLNIKDFGYDSTMTIINNYNEYIKGTIWEHLVKESTNGYLLYLPNIEKLETIWNNVGLYEELKNTNIYKLLNLTIKEYWSSSYYTSHYTYYDKAYNVFFYNGNTFNNKKTNMYHSVALLHF